MYAAWNDNVSTGDRLTADSWNEVLKRVEVLNFSDGKFTIRDEATSFDVLRIRG